MERLTALPEARPRVPPLWLPVEEEVARTVEQTALHRQERRAAGEEGQTQLQFLLQPLDAAVTLFFVS